MSNSTSAKELRTQENSRFRHRRKGQQAHKMWANNDQGTLFIDVGQHLRALRLEQSLSIRVLAERSRLNVNTISMIENGKTSPSVSTLQQLAGALDVPITAFFENNNVQKSVSYQKADQCPQVEFAHGKLADLGAGLTLHGGQPFLVTLEPKADSGRYPIVHTGHEFVYCLDGRISYTIDDSVYVLDPGDSLLFEAHLPHRWCNIGETPSRSLLIMCPGEESDSPTELHFKRAW
jgi:transcriptional regulator with XRE-family HTH domain